MNDSKFDSFMNDVMAHKDTARKYTLSGYDLELGDKKDEILTLYTEHHISRKIIFENLVKSGIISEDRHFGSFSKWMTKSIKRNTKSNEGNNRKIHCVEDNES